MGAGDVATVLKTVKVFVDFIPDPVKIPVSALLDISISICERVEQVSANVQAVADLAEHQAGISADVVNELRGVTQAQINSGGWIPRLEQLTRALEEVRNWVFKDSEDIEGDSKSGKALKALGKLWNSPEKKKEIDALKAKLDETREQLKLQLGIATLIGVQRITEIMRALLQFHDRMLVDRLKPVFSARYGAHGSPGDCLRDTRLALRDDLRKLLTADDRQRIVWLSGLAGTGKSTVARSICNDLKGTHDVVSFFIKRGIVERSDQRRALHTLVYQLAQCIPQVFSAVVRAKDELFEAHIHAQVQDLVIIPLSRDLPGARPVVIVLDAADERDDPAPNECDIIPCFLDAIATSRVPVRVLVTSRGHLSNFLRPTYEAVHDTQRLQQSAVTAISMHDQSYDPESDIRAYLAAEFQRVALTRRVSNWPPSPGRIKDLARMSDKLFIFATTVIRWVDCAQPVYALSQLMKQSSALMERSKPDTIFALYEYVIGHALDEDTPQHLLRAVLGKKPDDGTEDGALRREATLSILSTLRCVLAPLTRDAFAQLWAVHQIATPEHHEGAVAIAGDLISRLSGVLFVWEPGSSMTLLHASFGDFLDAPSSQYHISSETTHFDLASKCISVMLSSKDEYFTLKRASGSLEYPLLNRRLDKIPWIKDSDLVGRYSFAQWLHHAWRAPCTQHPSLLKHVRLAERGFWFAGVFLRAPDHWGELFALGVALRAHPEGVEVAYSLATVAYMCADEYQDFEDTSSILFSTNWRAMLRVVPISGTTSDLPDYLTAKLAQEWWMVFLDVYSSSQPKNRFSVDYDCDTQVKPERELRHWIEGLIHKVQHCARDHEYVAADNSEDAPKWLFKVHRSFIDLLDTLYRLEHTSVRSHAIDEREEEMSIRRGMIDEWEKKTETFKSITEDIEKWADELRYAVREVKRQIVKPYDELFIAALEKRDAGLSDRPSHEDDGPDSGYPSEESPPSEGGNDGVVPTPAAGHSLDVDAPRPPSPERQSPPASKVFPAELHSGVGVDPSPSEGQSPPVDGPHLSEGQSSQAVIPVLRDRDERAPVTASAASTVFFFTGLALLYLLLSSLFA